VAANNPKVDAANSKGRGTWIPAFACLAGLILVLPSLATTTTPIRLERTGDVMGTAFTVVVYGEDEPRLIGAVEDAFEEVRRLDHLLSNYRPSSEWSEVNRAAASGPVKVSPELFRLLSQCVEYSRASDGAFDITVGPLMKIWGFYRGSGRVPHRAAIRNALNRVGYRHIVLDPANQTVRFDRQGIEIDPGGIGKGYAVDRMVKVLKEYGVKSAFVTGGSSSMYALGAPPEEAGWRVKIRHPKDSNKTVAEVVLMNESMSTSGTYEKFFRARGQVYSHIMDPRTGYPATGMLAVSVIAPKTIDSEAWTKPVFVNGRQWAASRLPQGFRAFLCEDRTEKTCAWLP
jgi:thiamine biosynthesis lipoprotein